MNENHRIPARRLSGSVLIANVFAGFIGWILAHLLISNWASVKELVRSLF